MAESLAAGDLVTASARFAAIPADSVYKAPAMVELTTAREHHVLARTPDVKALIAKGKCKEAQALVTELETAAGTGPTEPLTRAAASCKPHT